MEGSRLGARLEQRPPPLPEPPPRLTGRAASVEFSEYPDSMEGGSHSTESPPPPPPFPPRPPHVLQPQIEVQSEAEHDTSNEPNKLESPGVRSVDNKKAAPKHKRVSMLETAEHVIEDAVENIVQKTVTFTCPVLPCYDEVRSLTLFERFKIF